MTLGDPARENVLNEGIKSAAEALKRDPNHVKALLRRAHQLAMLAESCYDMGKKGGRYTDAETDLLKVMVEDPKNREAHTQLNAVQEELERVWQEQIVTEA